MSLPSKPRFRLDHGRLIPIQECAPGAAHGYNEFSNRGQEGPEITAWPKIKHYRLTTGEPPHIMGKPDPIALTNQEMRICSILGLGAEELGVFLRSWMPNYQAKPKRPETQEEFERALWQAGKQLPMHRRRFQGENSG